MINKILSLVGFIVITTCSMANGIGVYGNYSGGRADYTKTFRSYSSLQSIDNTFYTNSGGGGFIIEFASLSGRGVNFKYRFKAGGEAVFTTRNIIENMYRINVTNLLYFKVFSRDFFTILLGPQIGANYSYGTKRIKYPNYTMVIVNGSTMFRYTYNTQHLVIKSGGANIGLSLNFDFNITENYLLFIQIGGEQNLYFTKYEASGTQIIINAPANVPPGNYFNEKYNKLKLNLGTEGSIAVGFMKLW